MEPPGITSSIFILSEINTIEVKKEDHISSFLCLILNMFFSFLNILVSTRKKNFPVLKNFFKNREERKEEEGRKEGSLNEKHWWEFGASEEGWSQTTSLCVSPTVSWAAQVWGVYQAGHPCSQLPPGGPSGETFTITPGKGRVTAHQSLPQHLLWFGRAPINFSTNFFF